MRKAIVQSAILVMLLLLGVILIEDNSGVASARDPLTAPRTEQERRTIAIYRESNEAVVFITAVSHSQVLDLFDLSLRLKPHAGTGSGVIVDGQQGIVLTNLHVVRSSIREDRLADKVEVTIASGRSYEARVIGADPDTDLAVLRIVKFDAPLTSVKLGDATRIEVGQRVLAIGNPYGLNRTLTQGIVSSLDRTLKSPSGTILRGLIQTDAAINPGNSGGPLLDMSGRLIGINTAIYSESGSSAGIGFAVPSDVIKRVLPELIRNGRVRKPDVGWVLLDTRLGPIVYQVFEGSPADTAGVQPVIRKSSGAFVARYYRDFDRAEIVTKINGESVQSKRQVEELLLRHGKSDEGMLVTLQSAGNPKKVRTIRLNPILR